MYTKEEASAVRTKFWTSLGKYLKPIPNAEGQTTNWINYKTGVSQVKIKTDAQNGLAFVVVEISGEQETRDAIFDTFKILGFSWPNDMTELRDEWNESEKLVHQFATYLDNVSVFRESDWPAIISFIKSNLLLFDLFWCEHKDIIELSTTGKNN